MAEVQINTLEIVRLDNRQTLFANQQWAYAKVIVPPSFGGGDRLYGHLLFGAAPAENVDNTNVMKVMPLWSSAVLQVIANLFGTSVPPSDFADDFWHVSFKPRLTGFVIDVYGVR